MKSLLSVLVSSVLILLTQCSEKNPIEGNGSIEGTYSYTSFDTTNSLIVTGIFTLQMKDSVQISGSWSFGKIGNPQNIGPQTGNGNLIGGLSSTEIWIELNPRFVDNNLHLTGNFENGSIQGKWTWIGFPGPLNWGHFEAKKK